MDELKTRIDNEMKSISKETLNNVFFKYYEKNGFMYFS